MRRPRAPIPDRPGSPVTLLILTNRLSDWPVSPDLESKLVRASERALLVDGPREGEVSFTFLSKPEIASLNRRYLGHDRPTDVIAFELGEGASLVGDVYISPEVAAENAADRGEDPETELIEHPEGPDRETSPMYALQEELLRRLADD